MFRIFVDSFISLARLVVDGALCDVRVFVVCLTVGSFFCDGSEEGVSA